MCARLRSTRTPLPLLRDNVQTASTTNEPHVIYLLSPHVPSPEFSRYFNDFVPILIKGLNNHEQHHVCGIAVGCVGGLMRGAGADVPKEAMGEIVDSLLLCINAVNLDRTVKSAALVSFGDIAMALSGNFEPYMEAVMQMLHGASQTPLDVEDAEVCEYVNQVRHYLYVPHTHPRPVPALFNYCRTSPYTRYPSMSHCTATFLLWILSLVFNGTPPP